MQAFSEPVINEELLSKPVTHTQVELARHLFESLETQVQLADRKVQAVFGLNAFLVAAISLQNQQSFNLIMQQGFNANIAVDLLLKVTFLSCVCIATFSAIKALTPRIRRQTNKPRSWKPSLFFFGDIRSQTLKEFSSSFLGLSNEEAVRELLASSHAISGILTAKYKMLKRSTVLLSVALLLWIFMQINKFFA